MPRGGGFGGRGGGGFGGGRGGGRFGGGRGGGGFGGGGFGMRRMGAPLIYRGGWGMGGSPFWSSLMAGGLGYMLGNNSAQQQVAPVYQSPYPYQAPPAPAAPVVNTDNGKLAQLQLLGKLHDSGVLTEDEFEREKQQLLNS